MLSLSVSLNSDRSLVDQIVGGIMRQIDDRHLRVGSRLPSIRQFAQTYQVSRFTVVEAYDRLVALGYLQPRRGAGFFITLPSHTQNVSSAIPNHYGRNEELVSLIRKLLHADETTILAGGPWLPNSWLNETGIRQTLNMLARKKGSYLLEYGNPFGYLPLRDHLALMLTDLGISTSANGIVLTQGVSQALDLIVRCFLKPGDTVLVDDPGYYNMFGSLRLHAVEMLPIPRHPDGPDVAVLERTAQEHRPKMYFTQSVMQNPTGGNMSPRVAFQVLQAAERYGFLVVEDDIFCDLQAKPTPRLATLDQLERVIYVRSFSKTMSGSLRVGFIACGPSIANDLVEVKMLTSVASSEFAERVAYQMLVDGRYRKYLSRLHERLEAARLHVTRGLEEVGMELFVEPTDGMFLWARFPHMEDAMGLAEQAQRDGIVLAPGSVFRPHLGASPWMRFNVAVCEDGRVMDWLRRRAVDGGA